MGEPEFHSSQLHSARLGAFPFLACGAKLLDLGVKALAVCRYPHIAIFHWRKSTAQGRLSTLRRSRPFVLLSFSSKRIKTSANAPRLEVCLRMISLPAPPISINSHPPPRRRE